MTSPVSFSEVGERYAEQLARGLSLTGESAEHYARLRIGRVREIAADAGVVVRSVLDFGCGTGTSLALLRAAFPEARVLAYEPSDGLVALAELIVGTELTAASVADLVYCNGVFHHIAPSDRTSAAASVARALRPGGLACIWENSPFNPGTRLVMSRVPFDRDALLLTPRELIALERGAGLTSVVTEFHFIFPRILRFARPLERPLRSLPLGGQYVVVGRRAAR
jgi:SAM-dependent methyltransferase